MASSTTAAADDDEVVVVKCEEFIEGGGGGGEEIISCLICLSSDTGSPHHQSWKQWFWRPGGPGGEPLSLSRNLSTVFLLRNLLGMESGQVASILSSTFGVEPGAWVRLCGGCSETARSAFQLHQECCKLQRKIEAIGEGLRKEIGKSHWKLLDSEPAGSLVVGGNGDNDGGGGGMVNIHQLIRALFLGGEGSISSSAAGHVTDILERSSSPIPTTSIRPDSEDDDIDNDYQLNNKLEQDNDDGGGSSNDDDFDGFDEVEINALSSSEADPLYTPGENSTSDDEETKVVALPRSTSRRESPRRNSNKGSKELIKGPEGLSVPLLNRRRKVGRPRKNPPRFPCPTCNHPFRCQPGSCSFQDGGDPTTVGLPVQVFFAKAPTGKKGKWGRKKMYFKCKLCDQSFEKRDKANSHVKSHSKSPDFKCPICGVLSACHEARVKHLYRCHPKATLRCDSCEFETDRPTGYFKHDINEHKFKDALEQVAGDGDKEEVVLRCKFCGSTGNWKKMTLHLRNQHYSELGIQGYPCTLCPMVFFTDRELRKHLKLRHSRNKAGEPITRPRDFICGICSFAFHSRVDLVNHLINLHSGGGTLRRKGQKCGICGAEFSLRKRLRAHVEAEHADVVDVPEFNCDACGQAFESESCLVSHLLQCTHSSEHEPVVLPVESVDKGALTKPLRRKHERGGGGGTLPKKTKKIAEKKKSGHNTPDADEKPFKCEKCNDFSSTSKLAFGAHLQEHVIADHFEDLGESKARCKLCSAVCSLKGGVSKYSFLFMHLRREHESALDAGQSLFQCEICGRGYNLKGSLAMHLLQHKKQQDQSGSKSASAYCCDKCDFTTTIKDAYMHHIQNHSLSLHFQEEEEVVEGEGPSSPSTSVVKYLCKLCGIRCSRMKRYAHLNQMHAEVIELQLLQCQHCGKGFNRLKNLREHLNLHRQHSTHVCEACGVLCHNISHLINHRRKFHSDGEVAGGAAAARVVNSCKDCGGDFSAETPSALWAHMKERHGELYKFGCDRCEKRFRTSQQAQIHRAQYHFEQEIECNRGAAPGGGEEEEEEEVVRVGGKEEL